MQIGDSQFPIHIAILFLILIAILFINIFFFHHQSFSIKYKLMRKHAFFRTKQGFTLIVEILFKLSYLTPFLVLAAIAVLRGLDVPVDLPFILVNGLILILIAFPLKRTFYLWKVGGLFLLAIASQFVNLFVFAETARNDYYTLLCSIFYPINSILFCLALLSRETHYWSIKDGIAYPKVFEALRNIYQGFTKEPQDQRFILSQVSSNQQIKGQKKIDQKYIRIPETFNGGLFGYLRSRQNEGWNWKFIILYGLSLCVLGVNAVTVWQTSKSALGVIGLVTNFIYDLFVFAFNNLDTPERSIANAFVLVFVGRFLSFAFGEQLWIFGYCVLYFLVGTFVGQIIINDRLPLRNFSKVKGKSAEDTFKDSKDALKTPEFVLFILTVEIIFLVAMSSFGIASSRTNVSYSQEVAVPLWQFAVLMVGGTWIVILILASMRIFKRKKNKIKSGIEYYFGSEHIKGHHIYVMVTYLLILSLGLYCNFFLKNKTVLYSCIFIPPIILAVINLILEWIHNDYKLTRNQPLIKRRIQKVKLKNDKILLKNKLHLSQRSIHEREQKKMLKNDSSQEQQTQKQALNEEPCSQDHSTVEMNNKIGNEAYLHSHKQKKLDHYCEQWIKKIIITIVSLCAAFVLVCYFFADSIFAIFFVICLLSCLSPLPFYRFSFNSQSIDMYQYIWFESAFALGVLYWSFFHSEVLYAMIWAGLNIVILSLTILYGVVKRIHEEYFMSCLGLNFLMTLIFISLFLAFTAPSFTAIAVSTALFLICLVFIPQAHAYFHDKQPNTIIKGICWGLLIFGVIGLSLVAFILDFFSSFAVFTCIMLCCYLGLMSVAGALFYQTEMNKYECPHVYSAYGLPIYKFDSRSQKIKASKNHKVLFDFASAILVIYGAITSMIFSHPQLAIYVLGYYYSSNFYKSTLFNLKTYSQLGEKKIDEQLLLLTLNQLDQKYMANFRYNTHSEEISQIKYKKKSKAEQSKTDGESDARWKQVARLDLEYILAKEEEQKFIYFWILLIEFHINATIKSKMVTFINYNKQIQKQLKVHAIQLDSLTYALDFTTKFQLLCEEIDGLSHKKVLTYKKLMCGHMAAIQRQRNQQEERGKTIYKLQKEKEKKLLDQDLERGGDRIKEFNQIIENLGRKDLFVDREFPHNESSLGALEAMVDKWKRPSYKEQLVHGQINVDYARQGKISNSYFISSLRVLGKEWIQSALGLGNQKQGKRWQNEKGAYMVRFFKFGKEVFVIVDDFLPVDQHNQYVFAKSNREEYSEIWPCILEKAYAKLYGGYENIIEGQCHRVLSEFSGGVPSEIFTKDFETNPYALWRHILNCKKNKYLMAAGSNSPQSSESAYSKRNILYGHAYSILDAKEVDDSKLIKLKNPQFNYYDSNQGQVQWNKEWNGDFSDQSQYMDNRMMRILEYEKKDDGIFWMKLQDFMHEFRSLYICKVFGKEFKRFPTIEGEFTRKNSYGLPHLSDKTFKNPQYGIKVNGKCTVFAILTQESSKDNNYVGKNEIVMNIYKAKGKRISKYNKNEGLCSLFQKPSNKVVISTQASLKSYSYPQTFTLFVSCKDEGSTGKYRLQILYKGQAELINDDTFAREQFAE